MLENSYLKRSKPGDVLSQEVCSACRELDVTTSRNIDVLKYKQYFVKPKFTI